MPRKTRPSVFAKPESLVVLDECPRFASWFLTLVRSVERFQREYRALEDVGGKVNDEVHEWPAHFTIRANTVNAKCGGRVTRVVAPRESTTV